MLDKSLTKTKKGAMIDGARVVAVVTVLTLEIRPQDFRFR